MVGLVNTYKLAGLSVKYDGEELQIPPGTRTPKDLEEDKIEIPKSIIYLIKIYH